MLAPVVNESLEMMNVVSFITAREYLALYIPLHFPKRENVPARELHRWRIVAAGLRLSGAAGLNRAAAVGLLALFTLLLRRLVIDS